jgi:hypothetical protein
MYQSCHEDLHPKWKVLHKVIVFLDIIYRPAYNQNTTFRSTDSFSETLCVLGNTEQRIMSKNNNKDKGKVLSVLN